MIVEDVLAENLYTSYANAETQETAIYPDWKHLTASQRKRWLSVALEVLRREKALVYDSGLRRAHQRIARRIKERLERLQ